MEVTLVQKSGGGSRRYVFTGKTVAISFVRVEFPLLEK
jgi:hypothetical protein